ncbi:MAG: tripartite tricarboxylate transporter substrate binding protein [Comamonadaceae bacterium]|nr:tripartite tricarboxylate transporter substrate binding protein [Comamonadaceae bacterium]
MTFPPLFKRASSVAFVALATLATLAFAPVPASAQNFPSKPIRLVVPFPAGGTPDILSRILGEHVGRSLGQPVLVENRGGAGGNIGSQQVAKAAPDGYTLLVCAFNCAVAPSLYKPAPFDLAKDFQPVALLGTVPSVLVVNPQVPAKTLKELIAYAKNNPNKLNAASSGVGGSAHLALALLRNRAGVEIAHVPYKGAGQVAGDLLGGQVDMYFDNLPASLQSIRAGKLRALAVASKARAATIPDVPTFSEEGLSDFLITPWFGVLAPAGTPAPIVASLNKALNAALVDPAVGKRLEDLGVVTQPMSPAELGRFMSDELRNWAAVIRKNDIKAE